MAGIYCPLLLSETSYFYVENQICEAVTAGLLGVAAAVVFALNYEAEAADALLYMAILAGSQLFQLFFSLVSSCIIGWEPLKGSKSLHERIYVQWHIVYPVATLCQTCLTTGLLVFGTVTIFSTDLEMRAPALYYSSVSITILGWLLIPCTRLCCAMGLGVVGCYCPRKKEEVDEAMWEQREMLAQDMVSYGAIPSDSSSGSWCCCCSCDCYGAEPSKTAAFRNYGFWASIIMAPREAFYEPFRQRLAMINSRMK